MTFSDFQARYEIATRQDSSTPTQAELISLVNEAARDICLATTPLELVEIDHRVYTPIKYLDEEFFIRTPDLIDGADSKIPFGDDKLVRALIYGAARKRSVSAELQPLFERNYHQAVGEYEMGNFTGESWCLAKALSDRGYLKPYRLNYALDTFYTWDAYFLRKLEYWLANAPEVKRLSWRNFIYDFIAYQNGEISDERRLDLAELDKLMKARVVGECESVAQYLEEQ